MALCIVLATAACERDYYPKPKEYPRVALPTPRYENSTPSGPFCGFKFRQSSNARVVADPDQPAGECWMNLDYTDLNARIHLSYRKIDTDSGFYRMTEDARTFAYKHAVKADDIVDSFFKASPGVSGIFYDIEGNTASEVQFFATDSAEHYLRGALYFESRPNRDSLRPIVKFIKADIDTLLRSLRWQ